MFSQIFGEIFSGVGQLVEDCIDAAATTAVRGIDHVESSIQYARENPVKTTLAVAAVAAASGYLGAGKIATAVGRTGVLGATKTTGTSISTLKGAALKSASLAKPVGGALSAGGYGVKGGKVLVSAVSGAIGGAVTSVAASGGAPSQTRASGSTSTSRSDAGRARKTRVIKLSDPERRLRSHLAYAKQHGLEKTDVVALDPDHNSSQMG